MSSPRKVLVTGAGGKTGRLVLEKLSARAAFEATGVVHKNRPDDTSCPLITADVCDSKAMKVACEGMDCLIICTSATPKPTGETTPEGRPIFDFPKSPEQVDWVGQKSQIDAAVAHRFSHVVICSSMGGTNPENPLNKLGRNEDGEGGNILLWKRKAEKYLIDSGLTYTIVHPGGLLDEPGGQHEIVVGVDDSQAGTDNRSIPRADVAELLVAALEHDSFRNRSFDARSKPVGEGSVTAINDLGKLLQQMKQDCDYSLGVIP